MVDLLTSAQMRGVEQTAFETGTATGLDLMERAGQGVVDAVVEHWPELRDGQRTACVLCGPGNNGGDGFVVARLLRERDWLVQVFLYGDADTLRGDALENHNRWKELGPVVCFADWKLDTLPVPDLVVDALFGTGLTRSLPEDLQWALQRLDSGRTGSSPRRVAVDAPSGLCMDSGRWLSGAETGTAGPLCFDQQPVRQDLTVSFHRLKPGHVLQDGPALCGAVKVADIDLDQMQLRQGSASLRETLADVATLATPNVSMLRKGAGDLAMGHKYNYGHALIISGGPGKTGAARLAARGALRAGAGLVTLAAPGTAIAECAAQLTAIMLTRCNGASDLGTVLEDERLNALCLGPGLGQGAGTRDLVITALGSRRRCVLDADALTVFSDDPRQLFAHLHPKVVLTPHGGEFRQMFPDLTAKLNAVASAGPAFSKLDATREAASRAGCTIVFKGPDTIVAEPDGRAVVSAASGQRAAPWLATAGSGDVLAGLIAGLMARGFWPLQAAGTAAWLHVEAAKTFGPGLIAEDIPDLLPGVLHQLGV